MSGPGPFDFRGARALIVGGGSGLGLAAAEALLDHGVGPFARSVAGLGDSRSW